ncbi:response regulator transcription factor [Paenibacillus daejeonensis]|uniref:response regulator transcription factor n=1 Tax=Paenibacillus daejeonensis TaxID=135193 RepID=UPI00037E5B78|nr:response regulator transcription factor [Paenibacillus daejeonensis]
MTSSYCKVLIVDDEQLIRQGIKYFMNWEQEGFQIVGEAANGQEALEMVAKLRPHIVITDIVMPLMDGEELTKQIKLHYPETEVIVLSSYGEFDYVRSTFQSGVADYILKPKLDMQHLLSVLKVAAERIPSLQTPQGQGGTGVPLEALLERLLTGYETTPEETARAAAHLPHPYYCLAGGRLVTRTGPLRVSEERTQQLLATVTERTLPGAHLLALPTAEPVTAILLNVEEQALPQVRVWAEALAAELGAGGSTQAAVCLSEPFAALERTGEVYRDQLQRLMGVAFYFPGQAVLSGQDLPEPPARREPFHLSRFADEFKRERFAAAFDYLQEHVQAMADDYTTDVFEYKTFLGNLIFNMTVMLGNMNYDVRELEKNKYAYFKAIEEARYSDEAAACLNRFVAEARRSIEAKAAGSGNANMKQLLQYINEHYAEPLSLTELARHFHFNPSYLSSFFTSHNDEGFVDYLQRVRTDKAAELLRAGEATISEIGGRVGFSDHSYFTKVFKKHTGLSPSRYRRQYLGDEKEG